MKRLLAALLLLVAAPAHAVLKVAIVEAVAASGTPPYTQDFTDSTTFAGATPKGAICTSADAGTTDTSATTYRASIGAMDGTREGALSWRVGFSTPNTLGAHATRNDRAYVHVDASGNVDGYADGTLIANGIRLTWGDQSIGETIRCVIFGGDIEFGVAAFSPANDTTAQAVTHNLSAAPEVIVAFGSGEAANTDTNNSVKPFAGFWSAAAQVGFGQWVNSGVSTTATSARLSSTTAANEQNSTGNFAYTGTIASVGATTFTLQNSVASTDEVIFVSLRSTSATPLYVKTGTFTAKTTTGTQADVASMSGAPQVMLTVGTTLQALDTGNTAAQSEGWSFGIAAKNSGSGTTQYGTVATILDDAATASASTQHNAWSNTQSLYLLTVAGATYMSATVSSWDAGGVTHNYGAVSGNAEYVAYAAIGGDVAVAAPTWSVSATVTAQDTNDYTLGYTPSVSATFYAVACAKDATAPTIAQVKAGNCTGDVAAIASVNEAVTGADTTVLGGALTRYVHDLYAVLSNAGGDSTLVTLTDEMLDAAAGREIINGATGYTSIHANSPIVDFNAGATPDIVAGDIGQCDSTTSPGGCTITYGATGLYSYPGSCGASKQSFTCNFYDVSATDLHADTMSVCVNNSTPVASAIVGTVTLVKDAAMATVTWADYFSDADDATLTYTSSATGAGTGADKTPAGTTDNGTTWTGTPTTADGGSGTFTITGTDPCGATATIDIPWAVYAQVSVPDVVGRTVTQACTPTTGDLPSVNLECAFTSSCSSTVPALQIISQDPAAAATVDALTTIDLLVSSGGCRVPGGRIRVGIGSGL